MGVLEALASLGHGGVEPLAELAKGVLGAVAARLDGAGRGEEVCAGLPEAMDDTRQHRLSGEEEPRILREQADILVLWKPPEWTVSVREADDEAEDDQWMHVGRGARPLQDWVAQRLGAQHSISSDAGTAYGLLHRLDRGTSGPLLCAKTYKGYFAAKLQFALRRVCKRYVCLGHGPLARGGRWLEAPLRFLASEGNAGGRSVAAADGDRAATQVQAVGHLVEVPGAGLLSLVEVELRTGRKHQIRAHLSEEGHPLVADERYGGSVLKWCERVFLHSHRLCADVGEGEGPLLALCPLPSDLRAALLRPSAADAPARALRSRWLSGP